jgi:hypothetical protein
LVTCNSNPNAPASYYPLLVQNRNGYQLGGGGEVTWPRCI